MKVIMKYDLPEDEYEYKISLNAGNYFNALSDIAEYMRSQIKYNPGNFSDDKLNVYEEIYIKMFEILDERNVKIYG